MMDLKKSRCLYHIYLTMDSTQQKRWVPAPGNITNIANGQVFGVWLKENGFVQWIWSYQPDGSRVVTGYEIIETGIE